ncbi:MAG: SH3 domain-containing protein [Bacilli bacterium]
MKEEKKLRTKIIVTSIITVIVLCCLFYLLYTKYGKEYYQNNSERKNETISIKIANQSNKEDDTLKQLRVLSDRINIRSSASVNAKDIGDVYEKEIYTIEDIIEDDTYYWYKIKTNQGLTGFIASNKLTPYIELIYETKKLEEAKHHPLTINDIYFENSIRNSLEKGGNDTLTEYDMLLLKEITIIQGTTDINEIKYAKNIETITINASIQTGLDEISLLPKLNSLDIGTNVTIDISFLKKSSNLQKLTYNNPKITGGSIDDICYQKKLKYLFFYSTINDKGITFLTECKNLEDLELWHTFKENDDISLLLNLPNLKEITLNASHILTYGQESVIKQLMKNGVRYKKI